MPSWPFDYLLPLLRGHSHGVFGLPRLFGIYNYVTNAREVGRNTVFLLQCLTANNGGILKERIDLGKKKKLIHND